MKSNVVSGWSGIGAGAAASADRPDEAAAPVHKPPRSRYPAAAPARLRPGKPAQPAVGRHTRNRPGIHRIRHNPNSSELNTRLANSSTGDSLSSDMGSASPEPAAFRQTEAALSDCYRGCEPARPNLGDTRKRWKRSGNIPANSSRNSAPKKIRRWRGQPKRRHVGQRQRTTRKINGSMETSFIFASPVRLARPNSLDVTPGRNDPPLYALRR